MGRLEVLINTLPSRFIFKHGTLRCTHLSFDSMTAIQTIETSDPNEAKRCRFAQFYGRIESVTSDEMSVTGLVRSVKEDRSASTARWIITIIPQKERACFTRERPNPHRYR